jgi:hypothetical protein
MKAADALTLEACLIALAKLETELPPELHQAVQQTGQTLKVNDSQAVAQLRDLVMQHEGLRQHYEMARMALQEQYRVQERAKSGRPGANGSAGTAALTLQDFASPILSSEDFRSATQRLFKREDVRHACHQANSDMQSFLRILKRTVAHLDPVSIKLMKELERKPATVENLSYGLNLGVHQVRHLAQRLQSSGYISPLSGNFFHMVLPLVGIYPQKSHQLDEQTYLSLTAKGYFQLNPVIEFPKEPA